MKKKIKLTEIEIQSFVTTMSPQMKVHLQGGSALEESLGDCATPGWLTPKCPTPLLC